MDKLVLFSKYHQETIGTTFSNATVRHYSSDDFYSNTAHKNIGDDDFTFIGGLNMLMQYAEGNVYQHIYTVQNYSKASLATAKWSRCYLVMIELTDENVDKINQLAIQHMFYDDVNSQLEQVRIGQLANIQLANIKEALTESIQGLYF